MALHTFNPNVAKKCGVNAAILLQNIYFWCEKNAANKKHFHNHLTWTYNSMTAWAEMLPYLTTRQIRSALEALGEAGYIVVGNFNKSKFDRTLWYAITEEGKVAQRNSELDLFKMTNGDVQNSELDLPEMTNGDIQNGKRDLSEMTNGDVQNGKRDLSEMANGNIEKGKPIPYINTDIDTDRKQTDRVPSSSSDNMQGEDGGNTLNAFSLWEQNISLLTPILGEKLKCLIDECGELCVCEAIREAATHGGRNYAYVEAVARNRKNGVPKPRRQYAKGQYMSEAEFAAETNAALEGSDLPSGW